jgi:hypothetical protein
MLMPERNLKITAYHGSVPASGYCEKCHTSFRVRDDLRATPEAAIKQFHADFDAHTCNS